MCLLPAGHMLWGLLHAACSDNRRRPSTASAACATRAALSACSRSRRRRSRRCRCRFASMLHMNPYRFGSSRFICLRRSRRRAAVAMPCRTVRVLYLSVIRRRGRMAPVAWRRSHGAGRMAPVAWRRSHGAGRMAPPSTSIRENQGLANVAYAMHSVYMSLQIGLADRASRMAAPAAAWPPPLNQDSVQIQ